VSKKLSHNCQKVKILPKVIPIIVKNGKLKKNQKAKLVASAPPVYSMPAKYSEVPNRRANRNR
jgi:hypothetical protein